MKIRIALIAAVIGAMLLNAACAEVLYLPAGLRAIDEEGFAGCETLTEAVVQDGVESIGERAFYGCGSLLEAIIPASVTALGDDCFGDCSEALLISCSPDSAALDYARSSGLDYDAGTVCRALVIGQSYAGTSIELQGTVNDAEAVYRCLSAQDKRPFEVHVGRDLTAAEIIESAQSVFADASDRDISLVYYSGHGSSGGELVGVDRETVAPAELRAVLDGVPGRKIVIVDACYSGYWVQDAAAVCSVEDSDSEPFTDAFMQGFVGRIRSAGEYYVIASARSYEECQERLIISGSQRKFMGCFTYSLCVGCGWNGVTESAVDKAADSNGDGAVSIAEAFEYASVRAKAMNYAQNAQTNAEDCRSFAPFR